MSQKQQASLSNDVRLHKESDFDNFCSKQIELSKRINSIPYGTHECSVFLESFDEINRLLSRKEE